MPSDGNYYSTPEKTKTSASGASSPETYTPKHDPKLERRVISAARELTESLLSPPNVWEDVNRFFSMCASSTQLNSKKLKKVKKMLRNDPSLAKARASNMGNLVPNGFTPLHAAASSGNADVAKILIDFKVEEEGGGGGGGETYPGDGDDATTKKYHYPVELDETDVLGRTALHVASEQGHVGMVRLLKQKMTERNGLEPLGENAPIDLTGRTPLGWAATSRATRARSNMKTLRTELFSPGDKSVYGETTPASVRTGGGRGCTLARTAASSSMDLRFGYSDMPGHRVTMEDAICYRYPLIPPNKSGEIVGFFGVFDGHGDGGVSSNFISDHLVTCVTSSLEWETSDGNVNPLAGSLSQACVVAYSDLMEKLGSGNSIQHGGSIGIVLFL